MRLLIMRHGESQGDILHVHEGRSDYPLTEKGELQAEAAGKWLKANYEIDKIYCSPVKRAFQTGKIVSRMVSSEVVLMDDLMEIDNGLLAGMPYEEATLKYPRIMGMPVHKSMYEMETPLCFRFRAEAALSEIASKTKPDHTVLIISHGGTINLLCRAFLKLPIESSLNFATGDTGIHEFEINGGEKIIKFLNRTSHCAHIK